MGVSEFIFDDNKAISDVSERFDDTLLPCDVLPTNGIKQMHLRFI